MTPAVLGVAEHAGWAHVICVSARARRPFVVARRRVELIEPGVPTQPYHHDTLSIRVDEAQALVTRVRASVAAQTERALQRLVAEFAREHPMKAVAIRKPPFPELPNRIAAVRASYQLQCSADGMIYQLAMCDAARRLGLDVLQYARGEELALAATALGVTAAAMEKFVTTTGRAEGSPWTVEHRRTYAMAIAALNRHARGLRLR